MNILELDLANIREAAVNSRKMLKSSLFELVPWFLREKKRKAEAPFGCNGPRTI